MQDEVSSADSVTNGRPIHNRNPEAGNPRQCWLWLGERSRAQQRKTAAERREVLRNGVVWRCSAHEATGRNRANTGAQGKKIPTDKGWDFTLWWWDGTPHQTTIESTESKRCGLLRTLANRIEKPAGTPFGRGLSSKFFALIGARKCRSTSSAFRGQFNSAVWESNPRPSDRYLPLPQLANGLCQSLLEQRVQVLINRLGRVLQRSAMVGGCLANPGGVQIQ